ncbi:MAG: hypothetical protein HDS72_10110 [Bacteroidales bacterium]|nr:hypothetical protein [Bacteroidales bacterium]
MKASRLLLIITLALLTCSCNKEKSLINEYIEACADGNFEKARAAVQKLETISPYEARKGNEYITDKEIYALLSKPSRDNDARILYIYNSSESWELPDMRDVVEVAISMGNESLAEKLIKSGVEISKRMAIAAANAEANDVFELILKKKPEYILEDEIAEYYQQENGAEALQEFTNKIISGSLNDELQALYQVHIAARPALGLVKSDHYGDIPSEYISYKNEVESLNNRCKELISKSVEFGHVAIANKAFSLMKPNLEWNNLGDWANVVEHDYENSSVYNAFKVTENRNEIDEARKLMQK